MLANSALLFVITGIQFWIGDYLMTALEIEENVVFTTYGVVCVTAPVLGTVAGNIKL